MPSPFLEGRLRVILPAMSSRLPTSPHDPLLARRTMSTTIALVLSLLLVGWVFTPLWRPLLLGTTFAAIAGRLQERLVRRMWGRRHLSALVVTLATLVLILAPLALVGVEAIRQALDAPAWVREALKTQDYQSMLGRLPDKIERLLRPLLPAAIQITGGAPLAGRWAAGQMQSAVSTLSEFAFDLVMMMIAYYFVLVDGRKLVGWLTSVSPLGRGRTEELVAEFRLVARTTVGSSFVTGIAQSAVATTGYLIAGVRQPLFFGLLTLLTSFIPSVGTSIVTLPLAGLLALTGHPWSALFLALWGLIVVGTVDNLLRPWLIKGDVQLHGALVFFSLIGGIVLFGFAGLVVGPVALTFFLAMLRFHARDLRMAARANTPPPTT